LPQFSVFLLFDTQLLVDASNKRLLGSVKIRQAFPKWLVSIDLRTTRASSNGVLPVHYRIPFYVTSKHLRRFGGVRGQYSKHRQMLTDAIPFCDEL
jgi:hypothetical protein